MKIVSILCLLVVLSGCASIPMGVRHNEIVEGNSISYVEVRKGTPTVIFESGLGDGFGSWSDVYEETSQFASVFAYSRPGYSAGFRKVAIGEKRTAEDAAALLRRILDETNTPGPYVLVGHSIGGLYMLEFARDYPELVAGMVLVDVRLPGFTERCLEAGVSPCLPPKSALLVAPLHVQAEIRGIRTSENNAPQPEDLGHIPAVFLAATEPPPGASREGQPVWLTVQREFAEAMPNGHLVIVEGSGHYIQRDAPEQVVDAIRGLVMDFK
jgi:pimeloyl-ACP methyl ester carboxylesterase